MHNRIKEIREARGMTQAELAKLIGTTNMSISRYEKEPHRITLTTLDKIASALRVKPQDIITAGPGALEREAAVYIPVHGTGGKSRMALDADIAESLGKAGDLEVAHVMDDTMEPTLRVGDICIVDTTQTRVSRDGLYVIDAGGHAIVRRVAFNPLKGAYVASADNKLYADVWDIHESDLSFIGRVVYAGRRM